MNRDYVINLLRGVGWCLALIYLYYGLRLSVDNVIEGNLIALTPIMIVTLALALAHILLYEFAFSFSMFIALLVNILLIWGLFPIFPDNVDNVHIGWRIVVFLGYTVADLALCIFLIMTRKYMRIVTWSAELSHWSFNVLVREWLRPWKLWTYAIGLGLLIVGAFHYEIADWDVGISITMATLTYLCAPWAMRTILVSVRFRPPYWSLRLLFALALSWAVVDGSYVLYNDITHHPMMREENLYASSLLYIIAGMIWLYGGSIKQFFGELQIAYQETKHASTE